MTKIETNKSKKLTFDVNIQGGTDNEIKEARFILSFSKNYKLMFPVLIEKDIMTVDIPPLNINENEGMCSLEMISSDNQYYPVWDDNVKFEKGLKIIVKEQKNESRQVKVESKSQETTETKNIPVKKEIKNILNESNRKQEFVRLYRTIKADNKSISKVFAENFEMMSKPGLKVQFYRNDTMLINDMESIDHGICIVMNVPTDSIIQEDKGVVIVDSTNLGKIDKKNVLFIIREGRMINVAQSEY